MGRFDNTAYHGRMRTLVLILLIALAPLRGMANELMATRMATTMQSSVGSAAGAGDQHTSGHHCDELLDAAHDDAQPAEPSAVAHHDGCKNCGLCQMCATAALPTELLITLPVFGGQTHAPQRSDRFASAPTALAQKPPIS